MVAMRRSKRVFRPRRALRRKVGSRKYGARSGALGIARRALKLASTAVKSTSEVKYYDLTEEAVTLVNNADTYGSALLKYMHSPNLSANWNTLFDSDPITGNKSFLKYVKGEWSINMANEEEAITFTVACWKWKSDADGLPLASHIDVRNGRAHFDPRVIKVLYLRTFTIYPGGDLAGDRSGTVIRQGRFYIPVNKMIRFTTQGSTGAQGSDAASYQDRYMFGVFTNNSSVDLESPKMNYSLLSAWRDVDANV